MTKTQYQIKFKAQNPKRRSIYYIDMKEDLTVRFCCTSAQCDLGKLWI